MKKLEIFFFLMTKMYVYTVVIDLLGQVSFLDISHNHIEIDYLISRCKKLLSACNSFAVKNFVCT